MILEAVSGHPNLTSLNLEANNAGKEAAEALCTLIDANKTLQSVGMSGNDVSSNSDEIREAVLRSHHVQCLDLFCSQLREDTEMDIKECLLQRAEAKAVQEMRRAQ